MAPAAEAQDEPGNPVGDRTIRDFGEQWQYHGENDGFYGSVELLADALGDLVELREFDGARVADIGSGAGRIVRMLLAAGAAHVTAVEPSIGVEALRRNVAEFGDRVEVIHGPGEALPPGLGLDFVTSIGVLQFVPDPHPVVRAAHAALGEGGRILIWLYSAEGNGFYHLVVGSLRRITPHLPHALLSGFVVVLDRILDLYIAACRWIPLPLASYFRGVFAKVSREKRRLTLYDQLNPTYVKYYDRNEALKLLSDCGFEDVRICDRRGYSWTVMGTKARG